MITTKQYEEAMKIIQEGTTQQNEIESRATTKLHDTQICYRDKINSLKNELYEKEQEIQEAKEKAIEDVQTKISNSIAIRNEHNKIITLIHNSITPTHKKDPIKVHYYKYGEKVSYKPHDLIHTDKYTSLYSYIVSNKKPKNKFSLIIVGQTIFNEDTMNCFKRNLSYTLNSYSIDAHINNANIKVLIKDAPSEKILIDYYSKNKEKIISNITDNLIPIKKEYEEAIELYKKKEWQIAYFKYQKYLYEENYSRGTELPGYKEIIKELKTLGALE